MAAPFEVPSVSLEDLRNFHARHFPVYRPSSELVKSVNHPYHEEVAEDEYDDGLGYYADGVKRTLTDEQIHMFRHSEIQRALRKKEIRIREQLDREKLVSSDTSERPSVVVDLGFQSKQHKPQRVGKSKKNRKAGGRQSNHATDRSQRGVVPKRPIQPPFSDISAGRRLITYDD